MSNDDLGITDIFRSRTLTAVWLGGPVLVVLLAFLLSLALFGTSESVISVSFAGRVGIATLFFVPVVVPVLVEILLRAVDDNVVFKFRFGLRWLPVRLFINSIVCGILWIILSFLFGIGFVMLSVVISAVVPRLEPAIPLIGTLATLLSGLLVGAIAPSLSQLSGTPSISASSDEFEWSEEHQSVAENIHSPQGESENASPAEPEGSTQSQFDVDVGVTGDSESTSETSKKADETPADDKSPTYTHADSSNNRTEDGTPGPEDPLHEDFETITALIEEDKRKQAESDLDRVEVWIHNRDKPAQSDHSAKAATLRTRLVREQAVKKRDTARAALDADIIDSAQQKVTELDELLTEQKALSDDEVAELREDVSAIEAEIESVIHAERADERLDQLLESIVSTRKRVGDHVDVDRVEDQLEQIESALGSSEDAESLNEQHDLGRDDEITQPRSELQELAERVETISTLKRTAEEKRDRARRVLRSRAYDSASETLDDLRATLDELRKYMGTEELVSALEADVRDIEDETARKLSKSRVDGLLGSCEQARSHAEELIEAGEHDRALTRLESAIDSLTEAETLEDRYSLGRETAIESKRNALEALLAIAETRPAEELTEHLESAEAAVARGIDRRDAEDLVAAHEAFVTAHESYEAALDITETYELPAHWEVEQRHSMVAEYVDITGDELDERRQSVLTDLQRTLEAAESTLDRADQHDEVDDSVSARESLVDAIGHLDEATQLIETGVTGEDAHERYTALLDRANELNERLPTEATSGKYRHRDLVESLQVLATKLTESPRPEFVNAYGEYPADAYLEAFGSWPEALAAANLDPVDEAARERRTYTRVEVIGALGELADELGHPPSKSEMNAQGAMSASTVENRFTDWETALELVQRSPPEGGESGVDMDPTSKHEDTVDDGFSGEQAIERNELAELYDAFGSLESVLDALLSIDSTVDHDDGSPLADWHTVVFDRWAGVGIDDAPNYGEQQYRRNDFTMAEYRDAYGDGRNVTAYELIETEPLRDDHRALLVDRGVIDEDRPIALPVAPESGIRLPVAVRTQEELSQALELLDEFPAWPEAETPPQQVTAEPTAEESESDTDGKADDIVGQLLEDMGFESDSGMAGE